MYYDPFERYQSAPPLDPIEPYIRVSLFSKQIPLQLDLSEQTLLREKGTFKKRAIQKFHHNIANSLHRRHQSRANSAGLQVESRQSEISVDSSQFFHHLPHIFWSGERTDNNNNNNNNTEQLSSEISQDSHQNATRYIENLKNDILSSAQNNESTADNSIDEPSKEQLNNDEINENETISQQLDNLVVTLNSNNNNNFDFQLTSFQN